MPDQKSTPELSTMTLDPVVEKVAKALYALEWEAVSGNLRDGHWPFETDEIREYWRLNARTAITAYEGATNNA